MNKLSRRMVVLTLAAGLLCKSSAVQAALAVPEDVTNVTIYSLNLPESRHSARFIRCRCLNSMGEKDTIAQGEEYLPNGESDAMDMTPLTITCVNTLGGNAFGEPGDTAADINLEEDVTGATGIKGSEIISYAFQYVGNAYVWGGASLTDGCDCSGFIMSVMEHFGIYFPHYSYDAVNYGIPVSPEEVKLGDVLIYNDGGHVALYMGNGQILEAEGADWGIVAGQRAAFYTWDGSPRECVIRRYI